MGDDLTVQNNTKGGTDDSYSITTTSESVQQDGEGVVHKDITRDDGAEEEVAHSSDRHDGLQTAIHTDYNDTMIRQSKTFILLFHTPLSSFLFCSETQKIDLHHNSEICLVQGHQTQVNPGEKSRQDKHDSS